MVWRWYINNCCHISQGQGFNILCGLKFICNRDTVREGEYHPGILCENCHFTTKIKVQYTFRWRWPSQLEKLGENENVHNIGPTKLPMDIFKYISAVDMVSTIKDIRLLYWTFNLQLPNRFHAWCLSDLEFVMCVEYIDIMHMWYWNLTFMFVIEISVPTTHGSVQSRHMAVYFGAVAPLGLKEVYRALMMSEVRLVN